MGWTGPRPTTTCSCKTRMADALVGPSSRGGGRDCPIPLSCRHPRRRARPGGDRGRRRPGPGTALVAAGYEVFAVNSMSTSRYRDRHSTSGAKSDPGDAKVPADMVRTDRHNHRPVTADSEAVQAIKIVARAHQSMIWSRGRQTNGLREFYPAARVRFRLPGLRRRARSASDCAHPRAGPEPVTLQDRAALRRGGRQRRIEQPSARTTSASGSCS